MIQIEGTNCKAKVYAESVDKMAQGFIKKLCDSPAAKDNQIAIMPDVHPSKGSVVGLVMTYTDKIIPGLIGTDIGCGIKTVEIKSKRKIDFNKLDKVIRQYIPSGADVHEDLFYKPSYTSNLEDLACKKHLSMDRIMRSIGTLGGGNHFIEIDKSDDDRFFLNIHTGSRCLGAQIACYYEDLAYDKCRGYSCYELSWLEGSDLARYINDAHIAEVYAIINRDAITSKICREMKFDIIDEFDTIHNYIDFYDKIIRKGAISSNKYERLTIPLNMADGCIIGRGTGNSTWLYSAPHGTGRAYSRTEASNMFTLTTYKNAMKGVYSTCIKKNTIDESPMAYKSSQEVLNQIHDTVEIRDRLYPVYNFKAGWFDD